MSEAIDITTLERIAKIIGPSSAAGRALEDYRRRVANGERVIVFRAGRSFFVGPLAEDDTP